MSVSREDVLKIAQLAELEVDEEALPALAEQMSRILDYVAQISGVAASEAVKPFIPGPDALRFRADEVPAADDRPRVLLCRRSAVRFRADEVKPIPLAFGPDTFAPAFKEGFFLVPKLGQFEEAEGDG